MKSLDSFVVLKIKSYNAEKSRDRILIYNSCFDWGNVELCFKIQNANFVKRNFRTPGKFTSSRN